MVIMVMMAMVMMAMLMVLVMQVVMVLVMVLMSGIRNNEGNHAWKNENENWKCKFFSRVLCATPSPFFQHPPNVCSSLCFASVYLRLAIA